MPDWLWAIALGFAFWSLILAANNFYILSLIAFGHAPPAAPWLLAALFAIQASLKAIWDGFAIKHPGLLEAQIAIFVFVAAFPAGVAAAVMKSSVYGFIVIVFWGGFIASMSVGHRVLFQQRNGLQSGR